MTLAVFERVLAVNVRGVFLCMKAEIPVMLGQKKGSIVNTASVAGLIGTPGLSPYCASKHAVIGLTRTASAEVAAQGRARERGLPGAHPHPYARPSRDEHGEGSARRQPLSVVSLYDVYRVCNILP